ncbi:MAG TPA: sulfite exporter TauE/SafE family protein [Bryobacteraceae bacterium]|nr:sulfite exporter TauE/SafE family protein [Bryobacteraceae bacterium]
MPTLDLLHAAAAFGAAFLAGAINSIAGGGTLVSFPTLIWLGLPSVTANATSTVAIWPGSLGSLGGYRRELRAAERPMFLLIIPSLIGGITGALLLRYTPPALFDRLVPFLILFATLLFMAQEPVQRKLKKAATGPQHRSPQWIAGAMGFQLLVALYGGYFGAGIGILMLAALSILNFTDDIHQMNGLKVLFGMCINGVATLYFVFARMVYWPDVIIMAVAAIIGGYGGADVARRLGRSTVRRIVVCIGLGMAVSLFLRRLG